MTTKLFADDYSRPGFTSVEPTNVTPVVGVAPVLPFGSQRGGNNDNPPACAAQACIRQLRLFARDTSKTVSDGNVLLSRVPRSCRSRTFRREHRRAAGSATPAMPSLESDSEESDYEAGSKRKRPLSGNTRRIRTRLLFEYPCADEMFVDIERELGLGDQEPFYEASGYCRPPPGHPDLAEWLISHESDANLTQLERKLKEDSARAAMFRLALANTAPTLVCGVCSCFVCPDESHSMSLQAIPGLRLLRKDTPATDEVPRSGHTHVEHNGVQYLLQPEALSTVDGDVRAHVCQQCLSSLKCGKVPKASLAAIDPGDVPEHLPKLTIMESMIISPTRLICHVLTLTPGRRHESHPERTEDSDGHKVDWTTASTGHTVAFRNPGPDAFIQTFPMHPDDIPSVFKVSY